MIYLEVFFGIWRIRCELFQSLVKHNHAPCVVVILHKGLFYAFCAGFVGSIELLMWPTGKLLTLNAGFFDINFIHMDIY